MAEKGPKRAQKIASFELPTDAVAGIFEHDADGRERVPDSVGRGEVFSLPRILAQSHDQVQDAVKSVVFRSLHLEQAEDVPERPKAFGATATRSSADATLDPLVHA